MKTAKKYYIRPIPLCKIVRDKAQWTYHMNYGQLVTSAVYVWYIESSEPKILVDAGVLADQYAAYGLPAEHVQSLESGLGKLGLKIEDIGIVILTHLHFDHMALAYKYPKAKFITQKKELDFALETTHPMVDPPYDKETIKSLNLEVVDGDKEIIEGVNVLLTPGHTPGSQSVAVDTPKGLAIIAGFCATQDNFNPPAKMVARGRQVIPPGIHLDVLQSYDSALRVKEAADIVVSLHDIEFMEKERIP